MKPFAPAPALLFSAAAIAIPHPRQNNDGCCFSLASVGVVNETVLENHVGDLLLGGTFQQGGFCLDKTAKTIQDGLNHNCFMRDPDQQFECYAGIPGSTAFDISTNTDGKLYLTYDNGIGVFYACPISSGSDQTYTIYSSAKVNKANCLSVALALTDETAACSAGNTTIRPRLAAAAPRDFQDRHDSRARLADRKPALTITTPLPGYSDAPQSALLSSTLPTPVIKAQSAGAHSDPTSSASSQACSVASSSPSIAPYRLSYGDPSAAGAHNATAAEAVISPTNSTVFEYHIPSSFISSLNATNTTKSPLCALQFRMPYCSALPKGYPCYSFSGLEQEYLSNSGMTFGLLKDSGNATWNDTALTQVFPGENTIIGTFECGAAANSHVAARQMSWNVSSVRNFSLDFLHAGVGKDAEFQDGIGAWIVQCQ
ncbi:hypothetical protein F4779DRAFT_596011 [Xylariaceae sp. FL0662B]|nr:hypothetical protein F4779DRAFT_596011 [Xylariaceae sp. FL0662B]